MLKIDNLSKKFGNIIAVDNISFTVKPGEVYALIGPNGAGKTTTLKIIVGLYRKDQGKVSLFGKDTTADGSQVREQIGYIPDEPIFYPYLKASEFLDFIRLIYGVSQMKYQKRLKELLDIYPISDTLGNYLTNFSRGNKQKLSIIAALLHRPKLLIVDEPILGLDPQSIKKTQKLFKDFVTEGGMILVSTHTLSFVEKVAQKVGIIDRGKIIFEGTLSAITKKVKGKENLIDAFLKLTTHD